MSTNTTAPAKRRMRCTACDGTLRPSHEGLDRRRRRSARDPRRSLRRNRLPARRPWLGTRRRHEPVGRGGLRPPRLRLPADPRPLLPGDAHRHRAAARGARAPRPGAAVDPHRVDGAVPRRRRTRAQVAPAGACGRRRQALHAPAHPPREAAALRRRGAAAAGRSRCVSRRRRRQGEAGRADGGQRPAARPLSPRRRPAGRRRRAGTSRPTRRRR